MARLPALTGRKVLRALRKAGFEEKRVTGSHHMMEHLGPPPRLVPVPVHGNRDLKRGTLDAIVGQSGLTREEFIALL